MINKAKIKLSLIDDYVKISVIINFLNCSLNDECGQPNCTLLLQNTQDIGNKLKSAYEFLFEKLNLNNTSFMVLKQQLLCNNAFLTLQQKNAESLPVVLEKMYGDLQQITSNLKPKLEKLKLNVGPEIFC